MGVFRFLARFCIYSSVACNHGRIQDWYTVAAGLGSSFCPLSPFPPGPPEPLGGSWRTCAVT